ncbi:MAG: ribose 5-phosphate isomerase B [Desulfovibrio sp.]|jgi:ribose 5-phosphate isomerase B
MTKTLIVGCDHGGLALKNALKPFLEEQGLTVSDLGTHSTKSCDYPNIAKAVCRAVLEEDEALGLLICGTGLGMSMTANRFEGIRAAVCTNEYMARMARAHNNANVLCLGERTTGPGLAQSVVQAFLQAEFEGGRHLRRINLMDQ